MDDAEKDLADQFLTMQEAAQRLGVVNSRIRQAVLDGSLPHVVLFTKKLIRVEDLEDYRRRVRGEDGEKKIGRPRKKQASDS